MPAYTITRALTFALLVAGTSILAAPEQTTATPGQMTQARVWVQNRGRTEAVPVELRDVNLDAPLKVQVINGSAKTINASADSIAASATSIENHASNVLDTAKSIQGNAGVINTTAADINTEAAAILDVANRINVDVKRINLNLDVTIPIASQIRADADNINFEAVLAHKEAACIDREVSILKAPFNGAEFCTAQVSKPQVRR